MATSQILIDGITNYYWDSLPLAMFLQVPIIFQSLKALILLVLKIILSSFLNSFYLLFALTMFIFMILFIPKDKLQKLFWLGMVFGSGVDVILDNLNHFLGITSYQYGAPFYVGKVPLWIILSWAAAVIMFLHFLPKLKEKYIFWLYNFAWAAFDCFVAVLLASLDLLVFHKFGPLFYALSGLIVSPLIAKYYLYLEETGVD